MQKMKKQPLIMIAIAAVLLLVVAGGGFAAYSQLGKAKPSPSPEAKKRRISEPVNVILVAERPYVQIMPQADGRNLVLRVQKVNKPATAAEYELEYQAGSILQGAFGSLPLGSLPAETKILLGSCSAGGACTYHTDVKGGTLLLKLEGETNYAVKSEWRYLENKAKEDAIASKDAKFQLQGAELKKVSYAVVYNTPGLPEQPKGTVVSDGYALALATPLTGKANLTMRATEEGTLQIMGWDGKKWQEFATKTDGKSATAEVSFMELYVLVKK